MEKYKFLEHTADIKFKVYASTLNEIFENSCLALADYLAKGKKIENKKGKVVEVTGTDNESLLCNFLNELIYIIDAEDFLPSKAKVLLRGNNLRAEIYGDKASNYPGIDTVKAATYSEMYVKKTAKCWEAQVVIDV